MHVPQGIAGWTVFGAGLLIIAYRIHGIDAPRQWIEWMERQFTYAGKLRLLGGGILLAAGVLAYLEGVPESLGLLGLLYLLSVLLLAKLGICMLLLQNHLRHLVVASAEGSDAKLRIVSIVVVAFGLLWALVPFF